MRVRIVSMFAMMNPDAEQFAWEGEVDIPHGSDTDRCLDIIFRLFNRVVDADITRLESWGYRMPSLSVGDLVGLDNGTAMMLLYRIESVGFSEVIPGLPSTNAV